MKVYPNVREELEICTKMIQSIFPLNKYVGSVFPHDIEN